MLAIFYGLRNSFRPSWQFYSICWRIVELSMSMQTFNVRMCAQMTLQNQAIGSEGVTILNLAIVCDVAGHLRRHPSAASCGRWKAARAGRPRTRNASASVNGHGARTASTRHAPRRQSHTPATWASAAARPLPGPRKSRCLDSPQSSLELHHYYQSEDVHIA